MARKGKLKELEVRYGEPLDRLIPRIVAEQGSILQAAHQLGVVPNALHVWLKKNGYEVTTRQVATVQKAG